MAVDGSTPGFNFYKDGALTGLEVELAEALAKNMGLKVEWTVQPFNTLLIAQRQDRFDIIAGSHTVTPQREKLLDFINPHYCNGANIVTKLNGPRHSIVEYIECYYNRKRRHSAINYMIPAEFEKVGSVA